MTYFELQREDKYTIIKIKVEKLDTRIAPSLKAELVVLNADGVKNIIIDLTETSYCDSSGLSAILIANRLCKNSNGIMVLTGLQDSMKKLIAISQLDTILNVAPTIEESIQVLLTKGEKENDLSER